MGDKENGLLNGFEHNHLFLNDAGKGFRNVGFLTGSAFEFDARAVLATDLDVDGRPDLLVGRYDTATQLSNCMSCVRQDYMEIGLGYASRRMLPVFLYLAPKW